MGHLQLQEMATLRVHLAKKGLLYLKGISGHVGLKKAHSAKKGSLG